MGNDKKSQIKDVIEIRDSSIDVTRIMDEIRQRISQREGIYARLAEIDDFQSQVVYTAQRRFNDYLKHTRAFGTLSTTRKGFIAKVMLFSKRIIRYAISPWLIQLANIIRSQSLFQQESLDLIVRLTKQVADLERRTEDQDCRINILEKRLKKSVAASPTNVISSEISLGVKQIRHQPSSPDFDYFAFEQLYRGEFSQIKQRLRAYLDFVEQSTGKALDIGCGRGEFVELLREQGFDAKGVDIDEDMIAYGQNKDLPIEVGDAIIALQECEDASFDILSMIQVVEHLELSQLNQVLELALAKLRPGGVLIAETPNPQCLYIFSSTFYQDPTHQKPLHPKTFEFLATQTGFEDIKLKYSGQVEDKIIPELTVEGARDFNLQLKELNNLLYGALDYALIARKPKQ